MNRRLGLVPLFSLLGLVASLAFSSPASAAFGLSDFQLRFEGETGLPDTAAGSHPFAVTNQLALNTVNDPKLGRVVPDEALKNLRIELPEGLAGIPTATPRCPTADFIRYDLNTKIPDCADATAVGAVVTEAGEAGGGEYLSSPLYNLVPPRGSVQKLGFIAFQVPVAVDFKLTTEAPYRVVASVSYLPQPLAFYSSRLTVWGNPASPLHDGERGSCVDAASTGLTPDLLVTGKSCPAMLQGEALEEKPFVVSPRTCGTPLFTTYSALSWQNPDAPPVSGQSSSGLEPTGCEELGFAPRAKAMPTTESAESPTGLDFALDVDDPGLTDPAGRANSDIKKVVVTLPEGVTTNPAIAPGLSGCSRAQYESETLDTSSGSGCPESSKIGSLEVETPLLQGEVLNGSIYVAKQHDNPFDSLLSVLMTIKDPELGILVQAAGKVDANQDTGQLTTTFDDLPQLPFSHFRLHFREGERAPLITPPTCGEFTTTTALYPWANPGAPRVERSSFTVSSGAGGSRCASSLSELANRPTLSAGTVDPRAGAYSPFVFTLDRPSGSQQLRSVSATLPKGLIGKLAGIPYCSEAGIAQAQSRSGEGEGALELAQPSCSPASELGRVTVGVGAGSKPYQVQGRAYLAGPYKGAPLSLAIVTPALAGPFDLGVVAVRTALQVDPESAQITAISDPIPQFVHGLPLALRSVALDVDRPSFMLNPTSCEPKSIEATATSVLGSAASLSQYFQASDCARLGFAPKLDLRLRGRSRRGGNPALTATLTFPRKGAFANIARAQVSLPHSEFLDQSHIRTICTRVQFAADRCPKGSIYGKAKALTPLLDEPLEGPVYLRSSSNPLPDLVADLRGRIHIALVGRIDSTKGRIRTTFEAVPDAPVSRFTLAMRGGKKGLLVNSTDICRRAHRATAAFTAQSGRELSARPVLAAGCGKHRGKAGKRKGRR